MMGFTNVLDVEHEKDHEIKGDIQVLASATGQMVAPFSWKRNLKKKIQSPGCGMVTEMVVDVGRNADHLFDYVASLWAACVSTFHVGGCAFMFVNIFALGKVKAYVWCGVSVCAYYFG